MKTFFKVMLLTTVLTLSTNIALAENLTPQEQKTFSNFAQRWVKKLNRTHLKGFSRMEIIPKEDGTYIARYYAINPSSVKCSVKKTSSNRGTIGLLKYIENVYESCGQTPKIARKSKFKVIKQTRVTEIFSNNGKGWR